MLFVSRMALDNKGEVMTTLKKFLFFLGTVLILSHPAASLSHTDTELSEWVADWNTRIQESSLTPALLEEWRGMVAAHPCHMRECAKRSTENRDMSPRQPDVEQWRGLVAAHFPASAVDRMLCLMWYESLGNPNAANPSSSAKGLFQIMGSLWGPAFGVSQQQLFDPETNVRLARKIWDRQGYWAWAPYVRGKCR